MTQDELATRKALLDRLRSARQTATSGTATVLDLLLRDGGTIGDIDRSLRKLAGVAAICDESEATVDWTAIPDPPRRHARPACLPLRLPDEADIRIGMADPWNEEHVRELARWLGRVPDLAAVTSSWLLRSQSAGTKAPASTSPAQEAGAPSVGVVIEFVDAAITHAIEAGASDVHFESDRRGLTVRLRHNGVLTSLSRLEGRERAEEVISRIKVLAQLDITERRVPQDGRFRWTLGDRSVDLRVSIMPSIHAEDAVLRLLDRAQLQAARTNAIGLDLLGFDPEQVSRIRDLAELPHGMLLVTGPTGSGKTTTVYAALSEVNTGLDKIITIEDPVEYELAGALQIPVNERKGLTFAKGLRSILRHDPDRILVGEIRDAETAEIAVQSSLTGHQVFTTVHANNMLDVTSRFRHFGIDVLGFMAALNGVVVQRLLRRACPHCMGSRPPTDKELRWLNTLEMHLAQVPTPTGCAACNGTGYRGRGVIAEVHIVDDRLRDLVAGNALASELRRHVEASGVAGLARQAARWAAQGSTTLEEIRRVVGWL
ncbi:GspE/PulE family protein [Pseudorhodoferax sp.]|uniref:GspE/PulE family protein n=1 Tax=Pseudorhodoferax sp. TaxID=1993553 RepID=UPI002DD68D42|nr:GspE/PulE family protein [Pseudorhodoferax sp.]